jgi:hypothetical protein
MKFKEPPMPLVRRLAGAVALVAALAGAAAGADLRPRVPLGGKAPVVAAALPPDDEL